MNEEEYWSSRSDRDAWASSHLYEAERNYILTKEEMTPIEVLKPRIFKDGDAWCCLYGNNIQEGIAGFGNTPNEAIKEFLKALDKN